MSRRWQPTGQVIEFQADQVRTVPPFDQQTGAHLWMMLVGFRVHPDRWDNANPPLLDGENMLGIQGPVCYYCERPWSPSLAQARCKGRP